MANVRTVVRSTVVLVVDRESYAPGETVDGIVCLNLVECLQGSLFVKFEGYEEVKFRSNSLVQRDDRHGNSWIGTTAMQRGARRTIFSETVRLAENTCYEPGQYQFPVVVPLPADLPPSFRVDHEDCFGCIQFKLRASVFRRGSPQPALVTSSDITVVPPMRGRQRTAKEAVDVKSWRCFSSFMAPAGVEVSVRSDVAKGGGTLHVRLESQNKTKHPFQTIELLVMRQLNFSDGSTGEKEFQEVAVKKMVKGFEPSESLGGVREVEVLLPTGMPPTLSEQLVQCQYWLEVRCRMSAGRGAELSLKLPLQVQGGSGRKRVHDSLMMVLAANWHAVQALPRPAVLSVRDAVDPEPALLSNEGHFWSDWGRHESMAQEPARRAASALLRSATGSVLQRKPPARFGRSMRSTHSTSLAAETFVPGTPLAVASSAEPLAVGTD